MLPFNSAPRGTIVANRASFEGPLILFLIALVGSEINDKFQSYRFLMFDGRVISGVIAAEHPDHFAVRTNLLTPNKLTRVAKDEIDAQVKSSISAMPEEMLDVLTRQEIVDLLAFLQSDGLELPEHLNSHGHES